MSEYDSQFVVIQYA